ncbi:unnamed protein product [Xylocopa violacea]|uniref:Uncharacterized protein n=1 Tax=Xylocopa violacea TaxID=135666 RepID=A0ABP1PBW1_XYLVO
MPKAYKEIILECSHVKASALLYEITERVKQLAQPRIRIDEKKSPQRLNVSQIPKASPRVIELSKPRIPYQYPSKQVGYVAPGALTAVATQRIIELSKPKRKRRLRIQRKRKSKLRKDKLQDYVKRFKRKSYDRYCTLLKQKADRTMRNKRKQCPIKASDSDRSIIVIGLKSKNDNKARRYS